MEFDRKSRERNFLPEFQMRQRYILMPTSGSEQTKKPAMHGKIMMAKHTPPKRKSLPKNSLKPLWAALRKRTKEELIDLVLQWARGSRATQWALESRLGVKPRPHELVTQTRQAIADATDFDEWHINNNFAYDYDAYRTIARNFKGLVKAGQLEPAMELSLELMRRGSHQVEMSDEGLMAQDIEACLKVLLRAVKRSTLSPEQIVKWCDALRKNDRVGFILNKEVNLLRRRSCWPRGANN